MLDVKLNTPELFIYLSAYANSQPQPSRGEMASYWACAAVLHFRGVDAESMTTTNINAMAAWVQENASAAMGDTVDVAPKASLHKKLEALSDSWEALAAKVSENPDAPAPIVRSTVADQRRTCAAELRAILGES